MSYSNQFEDQDCKYKIFSTVNDTKQLAKSIIFDAKLCKEPGLNHNNVSIHEKKSFYDCSICGAIFETKGNLLIHNKKLHHRGHKLFSCSICDAKL